MKSIKELREEYDILTEKDNVEDQKLSSLVRAGLYDAKKLPALKKALDKNVDKMSPQEKRMIGALLDSLITQVISNDQVYRKVRQNVMKEEKGPKTLTLASMPSILVLKRKAIRVYPNSQYVGLYYSQQIDKYVAVPFGGIEDDKHVLSMNEETEAINEISDQLRRNTYAKRVLAARMAKKGSIDQAVHATKAAKTAVNTMAKKGAIYAARMQQYADKYADAHSETQASVSKTRTKPRPKPAETKPAAATRTSRPSDELTTKPKKPARPEFQNTPQAKRKRTARRLASNLKNIAGDGVAVTLGKAVGRMFTEEMTELKLDGNTYNLNRVTAQKVQNVYESLNETNKKKMIDMMNESAESFKKVISFALRQ